MCMEIIAFTLSPSLSNYKLSHFATSTSFNLALSRSSFFLLAGRKSVSAVLTVSENIRTAVSILL